MVSLVSFQTNKLFRIVLGSFIASLVISAGSLARAQEPKPAVMNKSLYAIVKDCKQNSIVGVEIYYVDDGERAVSLNEKMVLSQSSVKLELVWSEFSGYREQHAFIDACASQHLQPTIDDQPDLRQGIIFYSKGHHAIHEIFIGQNQMVCKIDGRYFRCEHGNKLIAWIQYACTNCMPFGS